MTQMTKMDFDIYPPFEGFSREGIKFFKQLKRNNNREWFGKHKAEFEDYVKTPDAVIYYSITTILCSICTRV